MKTVQFFGGAMLLATTLLFASCEKETNNTSSKPRTPAVTDTTDTDTTDNASVLVLNGLGKNGQVVDVRINGNRMVEDLGLGELTKYIDLDNGQVKLDVLSQDGKVLASSNLNLLGQEFYNIVLTTGTDGKPTIKLLGINLTDFDGAGNFTDFLNLGNTDALSGLNFLNLTNGLPSDNMFLGADFINNLGKTVPGLLQLPSGEFSDPIFGDKGALKNVTALGSTLKLEDLFTQLMQNGQKPGTMPGFDDFMALFNNPTGLLDFVLNLLADLLGFNSNPLTPLTGQLIDPSTLIPGHDYTGVLLGDKNNPVFVLIDQTLAGLK